MWLRVRVKQRSVVSPQRPVARKPATTEVKLTTLSHPKAEMGADAAEILIDMIQNKRANGSEIGKVYKPELIVRESTIQV